MQISLRIALKFSNSYRKASLLYSIKMLLLSGKLGICSYFFIQVKMMVNSFPIKKITIPKVGANKPILIPPANTAGEMSPTIEISSNAPKSPMTKPKTPNTKENKAKELMSFWFFSVLSFNPFTNKNTITTNKSTNGTIKIGPPSKIKFIICVLKLCC
jgi:hypothetical protein